MSTSLVNLKVKEPVWAQQSEQIFVGKDVLELLSSSMYVDPLSMYREYIQNAADAYDVLREAGSTDHAGKVEITIDRQERRILIRDFGHGLNEHSFYHDLTSIGGSKKRGTTARGFRGVGRLAGLAYCQELVFRSRPHKGKAIYELRWDARKIRSLLRSADATLDLAGIVSESVQSRALSASEAPPHFFEVELRGVVRHGNDRLLDIGAVSQYLGQVAPVPFRPDFTFGREIVEYLGAHGAKGHPLQIEMPGVGQVFRPHCDQLVLPNGKLVKFTRLEMFDTSDRDGNPAAASWILHHEYGGALPKSSNISGWRLRFGDIQVGSSNLLEDLYPESRFNAWTVAESHILDRKIVPNGRRDNFEQSAFYADLLTRLNPRIREIAQLCRSSSINRNLRRRIEDGLRNCEESIAIASKKRTPARAVTIVTEEVERRLGTLVSAVKRGSLGEAESAGFESRIKKIKSRLKTLQERGDSVEQLAGFSAAKRKMLNEAFEAIYESGLTFTRADELIGEIISRLRRTEQKR
jgi:molecular chaperone HtpG